MSLINGQKIKNYFLKNFNLQFWLPDSLTIKYEADLTPDPMGISILQSHGDFFSKENPLNIPSLVFKEWNGRNIPLLFISDNSKNIINRQDSGIIINYDILGSAFYFLSGWQEFTAANSQQTPPRFSYVDSLQHHLKEPHVPWVNYYFDIFKTALELHVEVKEIKRKHKQPLLALTHDIDLLFSGWKEESYCHFRKGEIVRGTNTLRTRFQNRANDPWFNLKEIAEFTSTLGFQSSYFILSTQEKFGEVNHADYSLSDSLVQDSLEQIEKKGAEIGLHAATNSYNNHHQLTKELNTLNNNVTGVRFHYLAYDIKSTPGVLQESGITYDTTLGFAETTGFRNAITHPFYLFDITNNTCTDVVEIPLVLMDRTLQHPTYLNMSPNQAFSFTEPLLEEIHKFKGAVAILWHNSFFSPCKFKPWTIFFKELIKQLTYDTRVTRADEICRIYLMK